jgi:predicted ATPase
LALADHYLQEEIMELQLKNIGMIKEANVKIDGLTVIAGENDTGKSTVGKALYLYLNNENYSFLINSLFKNKLSTNLPLESNENLLIAGSIQIIDEKHIDYNCMVIETPLVWNFTDFFRDIAQIESQMRIELDYPYLMKDLNFKLHIKSSLNGLDIKEKVTSLMGGEFKKDEMGRYYFDKQGQRIELVNTATGIKYFGIFQILSQNSYLNEETVLVLDEPEVHLHPKWQLEMAKIIVELVKNGVKIVVNSHSPYMIEALKRYSELENIEEKTNFYLAEDGYIEHQESLENIFEKLAFPMRELKKLKMEKYLNA